MKIAFAILAGIAIQLFVHSPLAAAAEPMASVAGKVNVDGRPIESGRVFLYIDANQFLGARISKDGTFHLKGVPPGVYKASIEGVRVDNRYHNEDTSGLAVDLDGGANTWDIDLRS